MDQFFSYLRASLSSSSFLRPRCVPIVYFSNVREQSGGSVMPKRLFLAALCGGFVIAALSCTPTAQFSSIQSFKLGSKLVMFPALAPAEVSPIATRAVEKELTKAGHTFVPASAVTKLLARDELIDEYRKFVRSYNALGIVDPSFLKKFSPLGNYFMFVKVTDWAQEGSWLVEALTKSEYERMLEQTTQKVRAGETLVGFSAAVYSMSGELVYQDSNIARLSDPLKTPDFYKVAEMAAWKFGRTLPKIGKP
jgi:hypothetical protein